MISEYFLNATTEGTATDVGAIMGTDAGAGAVEDAAMEI
jgi:hypothetical protein